MVTKKMQKVNNNTLKEVRCNNCNKKLLEGNYSGKIVIKCPRCKLVNSRDGTIYSISIIKNDAP